MYDPNICKYILCQGRNLVILRGGHRYICNRKDEIIHGLCPSVKCVAPLFRDMSLAKYEMQEGAPPQLRPCPMYNLDPYKQSMLVILSNFSICL